VGASTKTLDGAIAAVQTLDIAMVTLNPAHTEELPAIQLAHQLGSGVLIKKALLSGHVAASEPEANGRPSAEACLRLALSTAGVSSVVVGTINREHLEAAVAVANELERPDDG
jgi:predicted aldo/keto reductase-like oxidoreductase